MQGPIPAVGALAVRRAQKGGLSGLQDWYNDQTWEKHANNIGDLRSWYNVSTFGGPNITTQYYDGARWLEIATSNGT